MRLETIDSIASVPRHAPSGLGRCHASMGEEAWGVDYHEPN